MKLYSFNQEPPLQSCVRGHALNTYQLFHRYTLFTTHRDENGNVMENTVTIITPPENIYKILLDGMLWVWASCQIRISARCAWGMPGTFSPPPWVSDPDMNHGTCVTHVPWCMLGSLISGFLWSWWRGKRSRHSRRMRNPQFHVSGKRLIATSHATGRSNDLYIFSGGRVLILCFRH